MSPNSDGKPLSMTHLKIVHWKEFTFLRLKSTVKKFR